MEIKVLASGSSGNCYVINNGHDKLLLECGIPIRGIRKGLDFTLSDVAACLVSHAHLDHSRSCKDIMESGVYVYTSNPTAQALGLDGHRLRGIKAGCRFDVGTWAIMPFETEHDCEGSLGFLLSSKTGEKLVFITDSYYSRYKFNGVTHWMIETNFDQETLEANLNSGRLNPTLGRRLIQSHMSLENAVDLLSANDLSKTQAIYCLHLSSGNANEEKIKRTLQTKFGKLVIIC